MNKEIINTFDNIIESNKHSPYILSHSFLFYIRDHAVFHKRYRTFEYPFLISLLLFIPIFFLHFLRYSYHLIINIFLIFKNINYCKKADCLFISHQVSNTKSGPDFYFPEWDNFIKKKFNLDSNFVYFDYGNRQNQNNKDVVFIPKVIGFFNELKILLYQIYYFFLLAMKATFSFNSIKVSTYFKMLSELFSHNVIGNLRFYYFTKKNLELMNPKYIFITFEGHAWESILCFLANKMSITVIAYQHSAIFDSQHSIFRNIRGLAPSFICLPGEGYKKFYSDFNESQLKIIGTNRSPKNSSIQRDHLPSILLIPEGIDSELFSFIELAKEALQIDDNVEFCLQLHPLHRNHKIFNMLKNEIDEYGFGHRFTILRKELEEHELRSNFVLYSGSTLVVKLIGWGATPILFKHNKRSNDPIFWCDKFSISNSCDLIELINSLKKNKPLNTQSKQLMMCKSYFQDLNFNILGDILEG